MKYEHIEEGHRAEFYYPAEDRDRAGVVRSVGPNAVRILSGDVEIEVHPKHIVATEEPADDTLPMLGERLRLFGGVGQRR